MNTIPKMHSPTAIAAALIICLSQIMNVAASISAHTTDTIIPFVNVAIDTLITASFIVILFRRKKDTVAGIVFLLALFKMLLTLLWNFLGLFVSFDLVGYMLCSILSGLTVAVFRGLSALECLLGGKICAGSGRIFLWLLPIIGFGFASISTIILYRHYGMNTSELPLSILTSVPKWLGVVLMGVSLSMPENAAT